MRPVKIITDSCSDLTLELREQYGIDYVFMNFVIDGKESVADLDWKEYSAHDFYDIMRSGKRILTTQVPPEEFRRVFSRYAEEGNDIYYIGCSLKQSSSVNTGAKVAEEIMEQYPDMRIHCVNSLNASIGEGMLAIRAAELRDEGLGVDEIAKRMEHCLNTVNEYCTVHSLDALKRAGRVKASAAFLGNLFGVKPIIISDKVGDQTPIKKVKGRQTSIAEIVSLLKDSVIEPEKQWLYVVHADCPDEAKEVKAAIEKEIPCLGVRTVYIGPIIGASIGPDAIGVFGFGKEVTFEG